MKISAVSHSPHHKNIYETVFIRCMQPFFLWNTFTHQWVHNGPLWLVDDNFITSASIKYQGKKLSEHIWCWKCMRGICLINGQSHPNLLISIMSLCFPLFHLLLFGVLFWRENLQYLIINLNGIAIKKYHITAWIETCIFLHRIVQSHI